MNTSYLATHNFSPRPETIDELKAGLSGDSYGKGSTSLPFKATNARIQPTARRGSSAGYKLTKY